MVLLPPHHVRPYVRGNKTDRTDAKGILEASRNEDIRPVPVKTVAQQVLTSLHRLRSGWMTERTARLNTLRGLLRELGVFIPVGARQVVPAVWALIEDADSDLPDALRRIFAEACQEIREIEARIKQVERQLEAMAEQLPVVAQLLTIPGIGLLTATALVAFIGDIRRFPSGRHLASYLGLTPREYSSGLKRRLGRISKRGDGYLRTLLIHGARSVLLHARKQQPDRLREWAHKLEKTHVHNKAAVAVANKLARIVWAVWTHQTPYGSLRQGRTRPRTISRKDFPPGAAKRRARDGRTGRTGAGKADNKGGPRGRCHRLASLRADSVMARGPRGLQQRGRRYVCSPPRSPAQRQEGNAHAPPSCSAYGRALSKSPRRGLARAWATPLHPGHRRGLFALFS